MIVGNPWGLLALLGLPLLVGLHLFRHRFRQVPVSGLFLWGLPPVRGGSGRQRERLRGLLSLLAEIAALLALTWFLSDPHLSSATIAQHHIVILDGHRRLLAERDDGRSVGQALLDDLAVEWSHLASHDRITLIRSGLRPQVLAGPLATAEAALAAISPGANQLCDQAIHDIGPAIDLAADLSTQQDSRIVLLSDRPRPDLPARIGQRSRGQVRSHSGLTDVRWWRDQRGERLHCNLVNAGPACQRRLLISDGQGQNLAEHLVDLPADDHLQLTLPLSTSADALRLQLSPHQADHLPIDDQVDLLRPDRRLVTVAIEPPLDGYRPLQRVIAALDGVSLSHTADRADLVIGQHETVIPPGTWRLQIGDGGGPAQLGPFLLRGGHPLMQGADARAVLWSGGAALNAVGPVDVLMQAGDQALIDEWRDGRRRRIRWHCQLQAGNLPEQPLWPVLFDNLIRERRRHLSGPARATIPASAPLTICLPPGQRQAQLHLPGGEHRELVAHESGLIDLPPLRQPGAYRLIAGDELITTIQVHALDPRMSDLAACRELSTRGGSLDQGQADRVRGPLAWLLPLLVAALAAFLAWAAWRREEGLAGHEASS